MKSTYLLLLILFFFQCTFAQKISYNNVVAYSPPPGIDGPVADYTVQQALTLIEGAYISCTPSVTLLRLKAVIFRGVRYEISQLPSDVAAKLENSVRGAATDFCYSILNGGSEEWQGCGGYNRPRWTNGDPNKWEDLFEKGNLSIGKVYIKNGFYNELLLQDYLIKSKKSQQENTGETTTTTSSSSPTTRVTVTNADNNNSNPLTRPQATTGTKAQVTITKTPPASSNSTVVTTTNTDNDNPNPMITSQTTSTNSTQGYNNPVENSYQATGLSNTSSSDDVSKAASMGVAVFTDLFSGNAERKRKKAKAKQEIAARKEEEEQAAREREELEDKAIRAYVDEKGGFTKTSSGLYYRITEQGKGPKVSRGQVVKVNYRAYIYSRRDGKPHVEMYDSNVDSVHHHVEPWEIKVGNSDVPALNEGLALLNKGTVATLLIPSRIGHGGVQVGSTTVYSILWYVIKVLED